MKDVMVLTMELPPRARRIHRTTIGPASTSGTTSACAENTFKGVFLFGCLRNYLRVRGEYDLFSPPAGIKAELPPRARRIPIFISITAYRKGTTSACAENTSHGILPGQYPRNYLRVRGEYMRLSKSI